MPRQASETGSAVLVLAGRQVARTCLPPLLEQEGLSIAGTVSSIEEALALLDDLGTLVVLLETRSETALAAVRALTEQAPEVRVVVLGEADDEEFRLAYVEAGAAGYVPAEATAARIATAVAAVARGEAVLPLTLTRHAVQQLSRRERQEGVTLTGREREIMRLILEEGLSDKQIAQRLNRKESSVGSHLRHIFKKLDVHNRTEAAAAVRQRGLLEDVWFRD